MYGTAAGVVLLGLQLVLGDVVALGPRVLLVVVAVVVTGLLATVALGRLLGTGRDLTLLIACGFSICGAAAVAAADAVVDAEEEDVVTAVALVVLFGTGMIAIAPALVHVLGLTGEQGTAWIGAAVHEVAQVVAAAEAVTGSDSTGSGAGATAGAGALLALAVTVKLARVVLLAPVVASLRAVAATDVGTTRRSPLVPLFVVGFVVLALVRSTGTLPDPVVDAGRTAQVVLLASAMFALGAGVRLRTLARTGPRPFVLAALSTVVVGGTALAGVLLVA